MESGIHSSIHTPSLSRVPRYSAQRRSRNIPYRRRDLKGPDKDEPSMGWRLIGRPRPFSPPPPTFRSQSKPPEQTLPGVYRDSDSDSCIRASVATGRCPPALQPPDARIIVLRRAHPPLQSGIPSWEDSLPKTNQWGRRGPKFWRCPYPEVGPVGPVAPVQGGGATAGYRWTGLDATWPNHGVCLFCSRYLLRGHPAPQTCLSLTDSDWYSILSL